LDGRILPDGMLVGAEDAAQIVQNKLTPADFPSIPQMIEGPYSLCHYSEETLLVARDPVGLKPLFIGSTGDLIAVASDRKALWAAGIRETAAFPPSGVLKADSHGQLLRVPETRFRKGLGQPHGADTENLLQLLTESVSIHTADTSQVAGGFSGGIDSTILAAIAKNAGVDLLLVTVGIGSTPEMAHAESTAKVIGLPIATKRVSKCDVEKSLDSILWLIEEPSLMKVCIAMAMHWTAEVAVENGRSIIMLGQGSDELFGGYKRFATILGEQGTKACETAISESIHCAHEVNYQRDEQAVSSLRAELRLPFATKEMTEFAFRVPLAMKVRSYSDEVRKWILRDAAARLGIPPAIALRPKKAIQHASGIEKSIRDIAKDHGLSPSAYLQKRFRAVQKNLVD
jgi:asparagine synthase (glutamine-hydrolysing)